ncbi:hypothetical protein BDV96DRAFT_602087 [Lophiotrema nucula]|uniref:Uncharacterized protein n=1 Tax=Lophiotrema nucula TaxID=690887 RepID=A0A6A5YZT5_9PLEO|nr:hypothetical protein BDV96DRAFT_602087 [Lophiotrema nucula]
MAANKCPLYNSAVSANHQAAGAIHESELPHPSNEQCVAGPTLNNAATYDSAVNLAASNATQCEQKNIVESVSIGTTSITINSTSDLEVPTSLPALTEANLTAHNNLTRDGRVSVEADHLARKKQVQAAAVELGFELSNECLEHEKWQVTAWAEQHAAFASTG